VLENKLDLMFEYWCIASVIHMHNRI